MKIPTILCEPRASACAASEIDDARMNEMAHAMALAGVSDATTGAATICAAAMLLGQLAGEDVEPFEAIKGLLSELEDNARNFMALYLCINLEDLAEEAIQ